MGPKTRKEASNHSNAKTNEERLEQLQADHELFLQAFEKPTQIYRYLRTRNLISPIYLNRNLTFMRQRLSRTNASRKKFKVDTLLDRKLKESGDAEQPAFLNSFMTLTFLGYYDKKRGRRLERVSVELMLVKVAHKKRKESSSSPVVQVSLGTSEVPVNPSEDHPPNKAPALSIPSESFSLSNGHQTKSYSLLIRVHHTPFQQSQTNGTTSGDENLEPSAKRRKLLRSSSADDSKLLNAELVVYDKHSRCLLTEGEYELVLSDAVEGINRISPKKNSSWEGISIDKTEKQISEQFDVFASRPTLKFRLSWSSEPAGDMVERPRPLMPRDNSQDIGSIRKHKARSRSINPISSLKHQEKPPRIVYQFLYNNNSRQQTEAREDLHCPWCSLNCMELYALLKHLKLSHPRFLFTYVPIPEGARIDVSVSELYDSTYVGNPHDMISQPPGYAFSRFGPVQRTSITNIIVCKPKRQKPSLSEFLEIEDNDLNGPYDGQRPFVTGHNRLYHYSTTCLPMPPHAILLPHSSDDEVDPPWLISKMCRMIDDFSDVNDGEKEFMKMWNIHVQHYTYVGDCQMSLCLKMFMEEHCQEIIEKNLYRNFVLHVSNLFEFGVLSPVQVFSTIARLQQFVKDNLGKTSFTKWKGLRDQWMKNSVVSTAVLPGPTVVEKAEEGTSKPTLDSTRKDFSGIFRTEKPEVVEIEDDDDEDDILVISEKKNDVVIPAVLPAKPRAESGQCDAKTE